MIARDLMERLQAETGATVLIDGKPIVGVEMQYGKPINLVSRRTKLLPRWTRRRRTV